ncbi:inositol monophosphatase family protein [Actinokineospora auranticolor]|uniref:inositol monophosphatase family protein n=1 Tax=Actinokineospora auranticolor TaxID=155976 RepID=UPI0015E2A54C|nr:inositol monophosphatase family protein [Actinokineospora auranticolor]
MRTAEDWDPFLCAATRAAHAAGSVVRAGFADARVAVRSKSPGDYVTEVDLAAEAVIREFLVRETGAAAEFVGEESGGAVDGLCWVVDPLDGTTNFVRGYPSVGVSIALVCDREPVVGVVHAPMWGETFTAVRGGGAFRNDMPIRVANRPVRQALCSTGFPFKRPESFPAYFDVLGKVVRSVEDVRRPAGASLDLAWVACGVFDAFFELGLGPWDVAAGALLVREAGGVVTDWHDDHDAWLVTGNVLAASPRAHAPLLAHTSTAALSAPAPVTA